MRRRATYEKKALEDRRIRPFTRSMVDRLQGIGSVGASAQLGIANAVSRFTAAASEVATAASATSGSVGADTVSFSGAARAQLAESQTPEASLEHGLIEQGQAKHDLAANVRVLQTVDEMMGVLVNLGSSK